MVRTLKILQQLGRRAGEPAGWPRQRLRLAAYRALCPSPATQPAQPGPAMDPCIVLRSASSGSSGHRNVSCRAQQKGSAKPDRGSGGGRGLVPQLANRITLRGQGGGQAASESQAHKVAVWPEGSALRWRSAPPSPAAARCPRLPPHSTLAAKFKNGLRCTSLRCAARHRTAPRAALCAAELFATFIIRATPRAVRGAGRGRKGPTASRQGGECAAHVELTPPFPRVRRGAERGGVWS